MPSRMRAFTLLELLIAIGIIAILTALSFPALSAVRRRSEVKETRALLERVGLALETYSNDFGDYPPSTARKAGLPSNGRNDGVECLMRCLSTQAKQGPYLEVEDGQLANLDGDQLPAGANPTQSVQATRDLLELIDRWGNPIAYLHHADYDKGTSLQLQDGLPALIKGSKSAVTGQYHAFTKFQLRSLGPDGAAETEDDVTSWSE